MHALVRTSEGEIAVTDADTTPDPGPGEAALRITRATPDAIDAAIVAGLLSHTGVMLRRGVGVVDAIGDGVEDSWLGARVAISPTLTDPTDTMTARGLPAHAAERRVLGVAGTPGLGAERAVLPIYALARIPARMDDDHAVFAADAADAAHMAACVSVERTPFVTIVGDDTVALIASQLLVTRNASVRVLGRTPERFALCEKWGVRHRHIDEAGELGDQDVVIVTDEDPAMLRAALAFARPRGRIVLGGESALVAGMGEGGAFAGTVSALLERELTLVGARAGAIADGVRAIEHGLDLASLISDRVRLDHADRALARASDPAVCRVLIEP